MLFHLKDYYQVCHLFLFANEPVVIQLVTCPVLLTIGLSFFSANKPIDIQLETCPALLTIFIVSNLCNGLQIKNF